MRTWLLAAGLLAMVPACQRSIDCQAYADMTAKCMPTDDSPADLAEAHVAYREACQEAVKNDSAADADGLVLTKAEVACGARATTCAEYNRCDQAR